MAGNRLGRLAALLLAVGFLGACASVPEYSRDDRDPFESYNRAMFAVNDAVDRAVVKPVAQGYKAATPQPVQNSVGNFFSNLLEVRNAFNNVLQGKLHNAASDVTRLIMNSTFGVLGLFDVATPMGLEKSQEDFGQTLGVWGVPAGPYVVLPMLGPSSVRDAPSRAVDMSLNPVIHADIGDKRYALLALDIVHIRARLLSTERALDEVATDRYMAIRNAYLERREFLVRDGAPSSDQQLDFLRELEEDGMP